ncbi:STAS domain-containing protein [Roseateles sp. BYS180W]|uniref:STAS domain-containing protein n=1 Tax=Roseateles rivi TaxID=3299028 RepID=A0ABW7FWW5_9BURK
MSESKESANFLQKLARFVTYPATDWADIHSRGDESDNDAAKAELRAMIERKRRNDFVRKRELDMLRRIRREGLSPEQLAALGSMVANSAIDEVPRPSELGHRPEQVKNKIDQIERQMVHEGLTMGHAPAAAAAATARALPAARSAPATPSTSTAASSGQRGTSTLSTIPASRPSSATPTGHAPTEATSLEINEFALDEVLSEAALCFARGQELEAEALLRDLVAPGAPREQHMDTWLVLMDLYRATAQQERFESLVPEYVQRFARSAPQWISLPQLCTETRSALMPWTEVQPLWTCPQQLMPEDVRALAQRCELQSSPWLMDWSALRQIDGAAAQALLSLLQGWDRQGAELRWHGAERLLSTLAALTPQGQRNTDAALWLLHLEVLRLSHRPVRFDEVAIDYCVTYEVSPPSWERPRCRVLAQEPTDGSQSRASSVLDGGASTFLESLQSDLAPTAGHMELTGILSGDISAKLAEHSTALTAATDITVSCGRLIKLDFEAAGDLLNWVLSCNAQRRTVRFVDAHRLVALFLLAMGFEQHARIKVRQS